MMKLNVDGGMAKVERIDACCCEDLPKHQWHARFLSMYC